MKPTIIDVLYLYHHQSQTQTHHGKSNYFMMQVSLRSATTELIIININNIIFCLDDSFPNQL